MSGYKRYYIGAGTTLIAFFAMLQMWGLHINDLTGDITCAGTHDDPCISYFDIVNPTAKSIYIYNYDEVELEFSPEIDSYGLYVKYYGKWHYTNFTKETRLGNIPKDRKYSFVFPRYSTKHFKLVGYKNKPTDDVKWGIGTSGAYLDPLWEGVKEDKIETVEATGMQIISHESWYTNIISDTEILYDVESATYDGTEFIITLKVNETAINKASGKELDKIKNTMKVKMRDNGRNQFLSTKDVYNDYNKSIGKITYGYNISADYVTETLVDTYNETGSVNGTELKNIITTRKEVTLKLGDNSIYITATLGTDLVIQVTTPTAYNATLDVSACDLIINSSAEDKLIDISNSACTYDTIMHSNMSLMVDIPETGHNLTFNPTNIIENQTSVLFNTTDATYFGQETVTVTNEYLGEQNLTRIRVSNPYAMNQYDLLSFNLTSYIGWNPNNIQNVWYDSYTGNTDNSTLKDTSDYNTWVDTCNSGNTTGMVGCWNFNELDGTTAKDRANNSANNNDGTLHGMNTGFNNGSSGWTTEGKYGNALNFDGVDDYVDLGVLLSYTTKSYWKKTDTLWSFIVTTSSTTYIDTVAYTCPTGMAYIHKSGGYCIDKYEASMPNANSTHMGNTTEIANRNNPGTMPAESKQGVIPWVRISQTNARIACDNAGKYLCTSEEWLGAANLQGQIYNLPATLFGSPYYCVLSGHNCVGHSYENGDACNTGSYEGCQSSEGVYDMVGNVWEWCNETVDTLDNPCKVGDGWCYVTNTDTWSSSSSGCTKYGGDGTYFKDGVYSGANERAVLRGGGWSSGSDAGAFCVDLNAAPSNTCGNIGFRCCSAPN